MNQEMLKEVFVEHIRDLYDAEKQLVKALPKLAKAVESEELAEGLRKHLEETQGHVMRLESVFQAVGIVAKGKPCKGMKGLIEEGNEAVSENDEGLQRDLAVIAGCQKVEHYEISGYGTARAMAEKLGMQDAVDLLQQTEDEEINADSALSEIAASIYESSDEEAEKTIAMGASTSGSIPSNKRGAKKSTR